MEHVLPADLEAPLDGAWRGHGKRSHAGLDRGRRRRSGEEEHGGSRGEGHGKNGCESFCGHFERSPFELFLLKRRVAAIWSRSPLDIGPTTRDRTRRPQ